MARPDQPGQDSVDVTVAGARARASHGIGAAFGVKGREPTREEVEQAFSACYEEADRYRQSLEPEWMAEYQQYHGHVDDPKRSEWQSQAHVPKATQAVDTIAARISQVMFSSDEWFAAVASSYSDDPRCERARRMLQWNFDRSSAIDGLSQATKNAVICGNGPFKVHYATTVKRVFESKWVPHEPANFLGDLVDMGGSFKPGFKERAELRLRVEPIVPTDAWLDPSGQNRYMIVRHKRMLSDLWALAEDQKGEDGKTVIRSAVYDPAVVKLIQPGSRDSRLDQLSGVVRRQFPLQSQDQSVDVYEFWGDLPDPRTGVTMYRNILATFVDRRWCVRRPEVNPFLDGSPAIMWMRARLLPNQIYGRGIIAHGIKLQSEADRMLRAFQDKTHLSISMFEIDANAARNPELFKGGHVEMYPGKGFLKKSGADRKIFTRVESPEPVNQFEVELFQIVMGLLEQTYGVSEWSTGVEDSSDRRRRTKTEVQTRTALAQQPFNEVAQYIERTALTPFVNKVYRLMVQYETEFDDPELLDMFADSPEDQMELKLLAKLTPEERWERMRLDTQLKVTGVTLDITRNAVLGRLQQFMAVVQADPAYSQLIDRRWLLRAYRVLMALPPQLVLQQADALLQAMQAGMLAQMQGVQPSVGGGPLASSGAPGSQVRGENANNTGMEMAAAGRAAG